MNTARQPAQNAPQLFLQLPRPCLAQQGDQLCEALAAFCAAVPAAALLLPQEMDDDAITALADVARHHGLVVLLVMDVARCRHLGLDGVQVLDELPAAICNARRQLGNEAIIGACCPRQRHAAMQLGEAGADYVMIDQRVQARGENLLSWWAEMCTVPVVAAHPIAPEELAVLAAMGAEFVIPEQEMWKSPSRAETLARRWRQALENLVAEQAP